MTRSPTLEIHIPISPTPSFFTMIRYLAATLRENGGVFSNARLIVSVGEDCEPFDTAAAHPELARYQIAWRWVDRSAFRKMSYFATGLKRWESTFEADYVLMADADICFVRDFGDAILELSGDTGIAGVIASYPPFMARGAGNVDKERWRALFDLAGLGEPPWDSRHPGYGIAYPASRGIAEAPPYYNFGFVIGTREAMNAIRNTFEKDYLLAADYMKTDLAAQAALTLSIVRNRIGYRSLPVRYNFWSIDWYLSGFPEDAADIRILHYLAPPFRKHRDNHSHEDVRLWIDAHRADETPIFKFMVELLSAAYDLVQADAERAEP
jgi:hypothetical protein